MRSRRPEASARRHKQRDGLVGDTILGVVEKDAGPFRGEALAARRVVGKERAEVMDRTCL
jgi:hypothetical protein